MPNIEVKDYLFEVVVHI